MPTDRHTYELTIINEIAQALNGSVDLNQALQTTLGLVADLLGLETGWIWLLNEKIGAFYLAAAQNLPPALTQNPIRMEGSCYCLDSFHAGDMNGAANINVVSCSRLYKLVDGTDGLTYHASVPLYAHGNPLGILNVASGDWRELSADDLRLLHTVGDMLGIAIERARLFERSQDLGRVNERNRLAREIHDTLAQGFAAISLQLDTADALLAGDLEETQMRHQLKELVGHAMGIARENLAEARRSVMDLRATPLDGSTLGEALRQLANQMGAAHGLQISFRTIGGNMPLPIAIETGLYRIAQEALTNICKHAQASTVTIKLTIIPEQISLTIHDDGQGFDPGTVSYNRYGITGMNERAGLLGGTLQIKSALGKGTLVLVQIPLSTHQPK